MINDDSLTACLTSCVATQVKTLILVKPAKGHPQNLNQIAASRLRHFSTEFTRNLDLPEALCSDLQVLQLAGEELWPSSSSYWSPLSFSEQLLDMTWLCFIFAGVKLHGKGVNL